jgi:hypothetical protein
MTQQPHEVIWMLTNAGVASRCLHVVAELGVADAVDDERGGLPRMRVTSSPTSSPPPTRTCSWRSSMTGPTPSASRS